MRRAENISAPSRSQRCTSRARSNTSDAFRCWKTRCATSASTACRPAPRRTGSTRWCGRSPRCCRTAGGTGRGLRSCSLSESSPRRRGPITPGAGDCSRRCNGLLQTETTRRMGPRLRGDDPGWEFAMFDRLKTFFAPPETRASRTARLVAFENGGRARWTPRDYTALAREGYLANAIVHRSVRLIAENAAACQFLVFEGAAERDGHPLAQLLTRPNPRQDGAALFETLYAHLLLAGNGYLEQVSLDDKVRELYALRPDRMKVVPGSDGWAEAYEYTVGSRSLRFDQHATSVPPILHLTFRSEERRVGKEV